MYSISDSCLVVIQALESSRLVSKKMTINKNSKNSCQHVSRTYESISFFFPQFKRSPEKTSLRDAAFVIKDKTLKKKRDPPSKITHNTRDPMEVSSHSMIGNNAVDRNILLLKISCKSFHGLTYTRSLYIYTYTIYTIYIYLKVATFLKNQHVLIPRSLNTDDLSHPSQTDAQGTFGPPV